MHCHTWFEGWTGFCLFYSRFVKTETEKTPVSQIFEFLRIFWASGVIIDPKKVIHIAISSDIVQITKQYIEVDSREQQLIHDYKMFMKKQLPPNQSIYIDNPNQSKQLQTYEKLFLGIRNSI